MSSGAMSLPNVVVVINTVLIATTLVSVSIRVQRPYSSHNRIDLQVLVLSLAGLCGILMSTLQCVAMKYGLGSHYWEVSSTGMETMLKIYLATMAFYFACNMFVKLGLLLFYLRTTHERKHIYSIWLMIVIAIGFGLSSILVTVFQCTPANKLWYGTKPGKCINVLAFFYANASIMIGNDIIMYIMPIIFTWDLQLRRAQRIALVLLFALGALVVVTSILRLLSVISFSHAQGDFSYHIAHILIWSAIENHVAIFIACAPSIKALVVGTLIPIMSSGYESVKEKVTGASRSEASKNASVASSAVPKTLATHHHRFSTRVGSIDSNDSRMGFAALQGIRMESSVSFRSHPIGEDGESTDGKAYSVNVRTVDDAESQLTTSSRKSAMQHV